MVEVDPSSLTGVGTAANPFSFAIPAANLPEAHRYAIKVAAVNANGAGPWSAMSEVAVYGESSRQSCWGVHQFAELQLRGGIQHQSCLLV